MKLNHEYLILFVFIGCSIASILAVVAIFLCWFTVKRNNKIAIKSEFEASNSSIFANQSVSSASSTNSKESIQNKKTGSNGDRKLAQSAQLFHYQLQKQQIIDLEKASVNDSKTETSVESSDNETQDADFTIYECPGLAMIGVTEVLNPMYTEEQTPTFNTFRIVNEAFKTGDNERLQE